MSLQDIICTFKYVELIISSILITLKTNGAAIPEWKNETSHY